MAEIYLALQNKNYKKSCRLALARCAHTEALTCVCVFSSQIRTNFITKRKKIINWCMIKAIHLQHLYFAPVSAPTELLILCTSICTHRSTYTLHLYLHPSTYLYFAPVSASIELLILCTSICTHRSTYTLHLYLHPSTYLYFAPVSAPIDLLIL